METQFPRRNQLDKLVPAEKLIYDAIQEVEKIGADPLLTDVVISLGKAKDKLSDFIDKVPPPKFQHPTVGRIIHFYPGSGEGAYKLPNGMEFAPAIVTQVFDTEHINLTFFVMARPDQGLPYPSMNAWSVVHESYKNNASDYKGPYWVYPPKV